jgi:preprotein translocase subunit SecY
MLDVFSGGSIGRMSILALSIMPYISASIIMQILTTVVPSLEALKKEGEAGRKKINQYTRYGTVSWRPSRPTASPSASRARLPRSGRSCTIPGLFFRFVTVVTLVGGTLLLMWLGEQITARGVGNGISLIIFAGIVAALPSAMVQTLELGRTGALSALFIIALAVGVSSSWPSWCSSKRRSGASWCSIPSARSATACMAARPRTCRSRSTPRA